MGDMDGLRTALSALQAHRRALDVTGHNIANVSTDGYSRQRLDLMANSGSVTPAIFSQSTGIGGGVKVGEVERLRDSFLESRGHLEHSTESALDRLAISYDRIELAFAEPGENGIAAQLADFLWPTSSPGGTTSPTGPRTLRHARRSSSGRRPSPAASRRSIRASRRSDRRPSSSFATCRPRSTRCRRASPS
jgi:hypothetical protein